MTGREGLDDLIRRVLHLPPDVDVTTVRYRETTSWDSVAHLQLLCEIEETYGLTLDGDDLPQLTDYAAIRGLVGDREA